MTKIILPQEWSTTNISAVLAPIEGVEVVRQNGTRRDIQWDIDSFKLSLPDAEHLISLRVLVQILQEHKLKPRQIANLLQGKGITLLSTSIYHVWHQHENRVRRGAAEKLIGTPPDTVANPAAHHARTPPVAPPPDKKDPATLKTEHIARELEIDIEILKLRSALREKLNLDDTEFNNLPDHRNVLGFLMPVALNAGITDFNIIFTAQELLEKGQSPEDIEERFERNTAITGEALRWLDRFGVFKDPQESGLVVYEDFLIQLIRFRRGESASNSFFRDFERRLKTKSFELPDVHPDVFPKIPTPENGSASAKPSTPEGPA